MRLNNKKFYAITKANFLVLKIYLKFDVMNITQNVLCNKNIYTYTFILNIIDFLNYISFKLINLKSFKK